MSDLRKLVGLTDDVITAAVDAVLAGHATAAHPLAEGRTLDLAEVVRTSELVAMALKSDQAQWKRGMVRRVILLAHPVKG